MRQSLRTKAALLAAPRWYLGVGIPACLVLCALALAAQGPAEQYRSYHLQHKPALAVQQILSQLLADSKRQAHVVVDSKTNQVLVRGPDEVQQIVQELIARVDRPPSPRPRSKSVLRVYTCDRAAVGTQAEQIRKEYAADPGVTVATDPTSGQLFILAPPEVHQRLEARAALTRQDQAANSPIAGAHRRGGQPLSAMRHDVPQPSNTAAARASASGKNVSRSVRLSHLPLPQLETRFKSLFGVRLHRETTVVPGQTHYTLTGVDKSRIQLIFDAAGQRLVMVGAGKPVDQVERLVRVLDSAPPATGRILRVLPLRNVDTVKLEQAARAYLQRSSAAGSAQPLPTPATGPKLPMPATRAQGPPAADPVKKPPTDPSAHNGRPRVPLVSYLFQSPAENGATPAPAAGQPATPDKEAEARQRLQALGPDIQIETLPDLDVIILRGSNRDVEQLTRIIEELERISAENQPTIEIVPLKHVKDEALARLIAQIQTTLLAGRQGKVSITPLVKPDSLLLIGWGDAMEVAKELIQKLDQPVPPGQELKVFPLRHASAAGARTTILQFLGSRPGLGTRVITAADVRSNSLIIQAAPRDMAEVEALIKQLDTMGSQAVKQVRVFPLKNSLATDLARTLQSAAQAAATGLGGAAGTKSTVLELLTVDRQGEKLLKSGKSGLLSDIGITPDPQKNTLIITAPAESMPLIEALIRKLDESPGAVAQIKVFRIVNGDANSLIVMLRTLLPEKLNAAVGAQLAGAEGETSLAPLRLSVDQRTNSIIATGAAGDLKIIEALLIRLDERDIELRKNKVYRLENAPALDVSNAINQFLSSQRRIEQAPPGVISPFQQIEHEVVVVPEVVSNSIIVSATPRYFEEIIKLVEELDAPPPQVMIQVVIAEVVLNNVDEFGIELGLQDSLLFDRSLLSNLLTTTNSVSQSTPAGIITDTNEIIQGADNSPGFNFNNLPLGNSGSDKALRNSSKVAGQGLSSFDLGRVDSELGFGGLVLSASSESVSVLIRALQQSRRLEVLARPQIMTLNNQPAFIQVGQRVPRIVASTLTEVGQINQVTLENVGLILGVTPRINPNGMVVMEIDAEQSKVGPEQDGIPISISATGEIIRSPRIDTRTAQTTVSAANGETIVLGGLITKSDEAFHRRVPYLADIPVLGHLFRYDGEKTLRTELLMILTPRVIKTPEDAQRLRHIEECRMNWTACDVQKLNGMEGVCADGSCPPGAGKTRVIYPDLNPRGTLEPLLEQPNEALPPPDIDTGAATTKPAGTVQRTAYDQPDRRRHAPAQSPKNSHAITRLPPAQRVSHRGGTPRGAAGPTPSVVRPNRSSKSRPRRQAAARSKTTSPDVLSLAPWPIK